MSLYFYSLSMRNTKSGEYLRQATEVIGPIVSELRGMSAAAATFLDENGCDGQRGEWDGLRPLMESFSQRHPHILFCIQATDALSDDTFDVYHYFLNGKYERVTPLVVIPETSLYAPAAKPGTIQDLLEYAAGIEGLEGYLRDDHETGNGDDQDASLNQYVEAVNDMIEALRAFPKIAASQFHLFGSIEGAGYQGSFDTIRAAIEAAKRCGEDEWADVMVVTADGRMAKVATYHSAQEDSPDRDHGWYVFHGWDLDTPIVQLVVAAPAKAQEAGMMTEFDAACAAVFTPEGQLRPELATGSGEDDFAAYSQQLGEAYDEQRGLALD